MSLAERLRTFRLKKGLSLQELADAAGVSKAHIWDLEQNRSKNPSLELLTKLADHLKVAVIDLVGENPGAEEEGSRVLGMYRELKDLSERDLDMIQHMIERLKVKDD
ncbi:helix-turn-helix domain-containing protein [Dongia sp.]|uniref:helix-turn-helix domain-containing protein n=1 Tax=Dongia sp. TaxID=1977262 RepID=UPI0035B064CC